MRRDRRAAASKAAKDKGKGKAVVLSILTDRQPIGESADRVSDLCL